MGNINLSSEKYDYYDLAKKYKNFFAPRFKVKINGEDIVDKGVAVTSLRVELSSKSIADSFSFEVGNAYDPIKKDFKWLDDYFRMGTYVEIEIGYGDKLKTVFYGLITLVTFNYSVDDVPSIKIMGMDKTFIMMKGRKSYTWKNKKYSEIVRSIGEKYVNNLYIDETSVVHKVAEQHQRSDFSFINSIALACNYEFFITGDSLYFRKKQKNQDKVPIITLTWLENLRNFSTQINLNSQVNKVVVMGYDKNNHSKIIRGESKTIDRLGNNSVTGQDVIKKVCGKITTEYVYRNLSSKKEAEEKADAILNKRAMELVKGNAECIGLPEIQAGRYIKLEGLGEKLNQIFYIKSVTHTINSSGYITNFTVGGNAI